MTDRRMPKVLLVDDDPGMLWNVGRCLTRAGFSVHACGDGAEAIPILELSPFDILITDIQMPKLNGLALIDWVRTKQPHMKVVVITAFGSPTVKQLSLTKGAIVYLEKPLDPNILIEVLSMYAVSSGFTGSIAEIELMDYVQLLMMSQRTTVLEIASNKNQKGSIYFKKGQVVHAECGSHQGDEAFYRLMWFDGGSFATLPWQEPEHVTIFESGEFLLLEAVRLKDEEAKPGFSPESRSADETWKGDIIVCAEEPSPHDEQ